MTLNHKKMIEEVNKILEDNADFLFDMDCKNLPLQANYTQEEAEKMSDLLGKIYIIAHSLSCEACQRKYIVK